MLVHGLTHLPGDKKVSRVMKLGLGSLNAKTLIMTDIIGSTWGHLLTNAVTVDIPQLFLFILYFLYNGLFTSMCLAVEWDNFCSKRKGLRVSTRPAEAQRSRYFLKCHIGTPFRLLPCQV